MQKTINVAQAFGIVGEMYDLTPRRVDAIEAPVAVTIGKLAGKKSTNDGTLGPLGSTYSVPYGVFVRPHEQVNYGTADGALKPTLVVPAGTTVEVCSMGRVVMALPFRGTHTVATASYDEATENAAALTALRGLTSATYSPADGDAAYADTNGGTYDITKVATSNTKIGIFIKGATLAQALAAAGTSVSGTETYDKTTVEFTTAVSGTNTITTATAYALVVVQFG